MNAECYWCVTGANVTSTTSGKKGDPFACCKRCQVFVCGHHGERDNLGQEFYCFDCNKSIAIASAINNSAMAVDEEVVIELGIEDLFLQGSPKFYSSWNDFKNRNPNKSIIFEVVETSYIDFDLWPEGRVKSLFSSMNEDSQKLLVVAAVIVYNAFRNTDILLTNVLDQNFLNSLKISSKL